MIDIVSFNDGEDLGVQNTQVPRAANILSVQLGSLEYAQEIGIDLKYFLSQDFKFENESFRSYLIEVLANSGINVSKVTDLVNTLYNKFIFELAPEETDAGLVAR